MSSQTQTANHLTDDQWTAALSGGLGADIRQHLDACAECQAEKQRMESLVAGMRHQIAHRADRPSAFWDWQLQNTLRRTRPRRSGLIPALAGTLALAALALLLLQRPLSNTSPDSSLRAAAPSPARTIVSPSPALHEEATAKPSAKFPDPQQQTLAAARYDSSDDDALLVAVTRAMQGPPVALQPAALLAQELLSAQITTAPDTRSPGSKGEIQ